MPFINIADTKKNNTNQSTVSSLQVVETQSSQLPATSSLQSPQSLVTSSQSPVTFNDSQQVNALNFTTKPDHELPPLQNKMEMSSPIIVNKAVDGVKEITPVVNPNNLEILNSTNLSNSLDQKLNDFTNAQAQLVPPVEINPIPVNNTEQNTLPQLPNLDELNSAASQNVPTISNQLSNKTYSLTDFFNEAIKNGASDIHISVGYRVMIRVNGTLKVIQSPLITPEMSREYAIELIKGRKEVDIDKIFEYDMTYALNTRRFRINIFRQMGNFSVAARVISDIIPTIEELDLPPIIKEFARFVNGLVLVTGPTGSGKSTTIASILNLINLTEPKHIITLEDPVEYIFPKGISLVDQRESITDFSSWPNALKAILRQDPNIVLVGEMRDLETIEAALRIAETGHLVFATLHTNSASQTVDRIIDMFPANKQDQVKTQLSSVIQAVVSQRLVKTIQNKRKAAIEIMIGNAAVKNAIRESQGFQIDNIIQTSSDIGMISLERSLATLVKEGDISIETAKLTSNKPTELDMLLKR